MASPNALRIVARVLWFAPVLLVLLAINQFQVAQDIRATLDAGQPAVAEVVEYEKVDRADVTYDYVSLRVELPDQVVEREKMSLPHSLAYQIEGEATLDVRVLPGADQPIVITSVAATQWRIAAMNAAISFVAALMFGVAIFAWNRYLRREGDPAEATAEA